MYVWTFATRSAVILNVTSRASSENFASAGTTNNYFTDTANTLTCVYSFYAIIITLYIWDVTEPRMTCHSVKSRLVLHYDPVATLADAWRQWLIRRKRRTPF